ncbi:MAG: rod shape-determining protein MreC [Bacteroidales bacterium]|jgi:rod shape-determining protein MreC|nr:rod shape-determining protein MreC [Bacteroidales bacterium]
MKELARFISRFYYIFLFLALEGLAIALIVNNSYYQSSAIGNLFNSIAAGIYDKQASVTQYFDLHEENALLVKENAALRAMLPASKFAIVDDSTSIVDTIYMQQYSYTSAQIISRTLGKRNNYFMINKGSKQGVKSDMGVICPSGLVGVILRTTNNFALIMPVLHQDSKRSVKNKRTQATGTLVWAGGSYEKGQVIDYPSSLPLKKGDTIISSGFSSNIPEGIVVGYVESYELDAATGFYVINIRFSSNYNKIKDVYVIKDLFSKEKQKLMKGMGNE